MNKAKLLLPLLVAFLGFKASASEEAGLFLEPSVTYEGSGQSKTDWPAPFQNSSGTIEGVGVGARLGLHIADIFFVGADARYSQPSVKDSSSNNFAADATAYNYGLVAGLQTPVAGLRVWGTYVLGGEINPKEFSNGVDVKFKDGQGYRVGAGLYVSVVSVNLEYQNIKYSTIDVEKAGPAAFTMKDHSMTNESYVLSVSFPIAL